MLTRFLADHLVQLNAKLRLRKKPLGTGDHQLDALRILPLGVGLAAH